MAEDNIKEGQLKKNYFVAESALRDFLFNKYWKYNNKPLELKPNTFTDMKERIGFYDGFTMPTFMNHARIIHIKFSDDTYVFCEEDFEICKKKVKNKNGHFMQLVDVKCPHCTHIGIYDMQYLVWKLNCEVCRHTITIDDRVEKFEFNMADFR